MTGAMYGAAFGVLAGLARLCGAMLVIAATVWGLLVFACSAFVGLPAAAPVFDSGPQIAEMAKMVGYGTFVVEHLIVGLVLGLVLAMESRGQRPLSSWAAGAGCFDKRLTHSTGGLHHRPRAVRRAPCAVSTSGRCRHGRPHLHSEAVEVRT